MAAEPYAIREVAAIRKIAVKLAAAQVIYSGPVDTVLDRNENTRAAAIKRVMAAAKDIYDQTNLINVTKD